MKKITKALTIAGLVSVSSVGVLTGCGKNETPDTSYIELKGIDTIVVQNYDLAFEDAKILYYENKDDANPDEITLKSDMISGFDSSTTGEKSMKVTLVGKTFEVNYTVIALDYVSELYAAAVENLANATSVKIDEDMNNTQLMIKNGIAYKKRSESYQLWYVYEDGEWVGYYKAGDSNAIKQTESDTTNLVNNFKGEKLSICQMPENLNEFLTAVPEDTCVVDVDISNESTKIKFYYQSLGGSFVIEIREGKVTKITLPDGVESSYHEHFVTFDYDEANINIPSLPSVS